MMLGVRLALWLLAAVTALAVVDGSGSRPVWERDPEELLGGVMSMALLSCVAGVTYVVGLRTWAGSLLGGAGLVVVFGGFMAWVNRQAEVSGMGGTTSWVCRW